MINLVEINHDDQKFSLDFGDLKLGVVNIFKRVFGRRILKMALCFCRVNLIRVVAFLTMGMIFKCARGWRTRA